MHKVVLPVQRGNWDWVTLKFLSPTNAFVGDKNFSVIKTHGTTVKIIDAQQAKLRNNYKNTKLKLLKTNAAIWFNKICKIKHEEVHLLLIRISVLSKCTVQQ